MTDDITTHPDYCRLADACCRCVCASRYTYGAGIDPEKLPEVFRLVELLAEDAVSACMSFAEITSWQIALHKAWIAAKIRNDLAAQSMTQKPGES